MTSEKSRRWPLVAVVAVLAAGLLGTSPSVFADPVAGNDAPGGVRAAPPLPSVRTNVEPGTINVEKLNKRVKDAKQRKKFSENDRKKYGVAVYKDRGHSGKTKKKYTR